MKQAAIVLTLLILVVVCGCTVLGKGMGVYFLKDGKPISVNRELPTLENPVLTAMDQLMKGPTDQETAAGLVTAIPSGTRVIKAEVDSDVAIIDFNEGLAQAN